MNGSNTMEPPNTLVPHNKGGVDSALARHKRVIPLQEGKPLPGSQEKCGADEGIEAHCLLPLFALLPGLLHRYRFGPLQCEGIYVCGLCCLP